MNTIAPTPSAPPMTTGRSPPVDTHESYWKRDSSVNAVSFGFIATAVFISVFLVMAVFEKFLRRSSTIPVSSIHHEDINDMEAAAGQPSRKRAEVCDLEKRYVTGVSVLMPGQVMPTFIANPLPLPSGDERSSLRTYGHADVGACSFVSSSGGRTKSDHEEGGTEIV